MLRLNLLTMVLCLECVVGCGKSDRELLDEYYPDRVEVVAVGGTITIDGQPTENLSLRLVRADANEAGAQDHKTFTDEKGRFAFSTYLDGDGVPPGKYILLVEQLKDAGRGQWIGPDGLKNLYNSLSSPAAELDVSSPNVDLLFDLAIAQKTGNKASGTSKGRAGGRPPKSRS